MRDNAPDAAAPTVGVVVPAAGTGQRMGGVHKALLPVAGEPLLLHALRPFVDERLVRAIVVVAGDALLEDVPGWLTALAPRVRCVRGGATRTESVRNGVAALPDSIELIAIHDAARPLLTPELLTRCIDTAMSGVGAVAGCPAVDTMKEVDAHGSIVGSPDRSRLWHAHTPQIFPAPQLRAAYASGLADTDDAALVTAAGGKVVMVDDGGSNLKVTRPLDVPLAEALLEAEANRGA